MIYNIHRYRTLYYVFSTLLLPLPDIGSVPSWAIDVDSTILCDMNNHEYLDISSLECLKCNDGR